MSKSAEHPKEKPELASSWSLLPVSTTLVRRYFVPLLYVLILPSLLEALGSVLAHDFKTFDNRTIVGTVLIAVGALWGLGSLAALNYIRLSAVKNRDVTVGEAYRKSFKYLLRNIGLQIVYGLLVGIGFVLLIVPGFIMFRRYYLAAYYLNDHNLSIRESLKRSAQDSKPVAGYVWGIIGVNFALALVGGIINVVPGGIGIVVSVLLSCLYSFAPVLRYKEISGGAKPPLAQDWSLVEH